MEDKRFIILVRLIESLVKEAKEKMTNSDDESERAKQKIRFQAYMDIIFEICRTDVEVE